MYPDLFHAKVGDQVAADAVDDQAWIEQEFLPGVGKRGAAIIEARGASSAASAANAAIDHMHDWVRGTDGGWVSMGVPSDGSYGIPEGLICGFPCTCAGGEWSIVEGLDLDDVLPRAHRRERQRASGGAHRGAGARFDLSHGIGLASDRTESPQKTAPACRHAGAVLHLRAFRQAAYRLGCQPLPCLRTLPSSSRIGSTR